MDMDMGNRKRKFNDDGNDADDENDDLELNEIYSNKRKKCIGDLENKMKKMSLKRKNYDDYDNKPKKIKFRDEYNNIIDDSNEILYKLKNIKLEQTENILTINEDEYSKNTEYYDYYCKNRVHVKFNKNNIIYNYLS
jgi:hypothetical protein